MMIMKMAQFYKERIKTMVNSELKYYVIAVRRNKKKDVTLFLVEAAYREMVERGFNEVKDKIPVIDSTTCTIEEIYDTTDPNEYLMLFTKYRDSSILFKIRYSEIDTFYLCETHIVLSNTTFHEYPLSIVHIQSRQAIIEDKEWNKKREINNEKIRSLVMVNKMSDSVIETGMLWKWDEVTTDVWETILHSNDLAVVFYDSTLNNIINLAKMLYCLPEASGRFLYFFFVDKESIVYQVSFGEDMVISPIERGRYIV